jgi:hypothetical protein
LIGTFHHPGNNNKKTPSPSLEGRRRKCIRSIRGATLIRSLPGGKEPLLPVNGGCRWRVSRWLAGGLPCLCAAASHQPTALLRASPGTFPVPRLLSYFRSSSVPVSQETVKHFYNCHTFAFVKAASVGFELSPAKTPISPEEYVPSETEAANRRLIYRYRSLPRATTVKRLA